MNKRICGLWLKCKSFHWRALKINSVISIWVEACTIPSPLSLYTQYPTGWIKPYILVHLPKWLIFLTILADTYKTYCLPCTGFFSHLNSEKIHSEKFQKSQRKLMEPFFFSLDVKTLTKSYFRILFSRNLQTATPRNFCNTLGSVDASVDTCKIRFWLWI